MMLLILKGMLVSGGLIIAIGSQNVFVLKQALLRKHIFIVCLICFLCDFFLMLIGVLGVGQIISTNAISTITLAFLGVIFLFSYGLTSFVKSFRSADSMLAYSDKGGKENTLKATVLATFAVTLLNPHVYLDTVVIVGGVAGTLDLVGKIYFLIGALLSSFFWFFGLGYGGRLLAPVFTNPTNWRVLEFIIGCIMWYISYELIKFALIAFNAI